MFDYLDRWDSVSVKVKHLLVLLLAYMVTHFVFFTFFYSGFIGAYADLVKHLPRFAKAVPLLKLVPYSFSSPFLAAFCNPFFALGVLVVSVPFIGKTSKLSWAIIEDKKWVRLLCFTAVIMLAWELSTYDYNYYLNTPQYIDRILLVIFALLILWNPGFILPFLILSLFYRSQFNYPIGGFPLMDKRVLFDILVLMYTYLLLSAYVKEFRVSMLFIFLCLIGSNYFYPGLSKLMASPHGYEWLFKNDLVNFFANMHQYGWLSNASTDTINALGKFLKKFGFLFKLITLCIELSGVLLLWKRKTAIPILILFASTHLAIFIFGGMIFWKWIAIDLVLFFIVLRNKNNEAIFNKQNFLLSIPIIVLSYIWFSPFPFGWFDTRVSQYMTYQVEDDKGNIYNLERNSMNPYHQLFQYDSFLYLVNENTLDIKPFGNTNKYKEAKVLNSVSEEDLPGLIGKYGKNRYDSTKVKAYESFIKTYFANRNKQIGVTFFLALLAAPNHLYNGAPMPVYTGQERVKRFIVILNETHREGEWTEPSSITYTKQKLVDTIDIPQ